MLPRLNISGVSIDDVFELNKIRYNTNNHWEDDTPPPDYCSVLAKTNTCHWIDSFKSYHKITFILNSFSYLWLKEANRIGCQTKRFPRQYEDELEELSSLLESQYKEWFDGTRYFVRTETVSLKEGMHGVGPYTTIKSIIESLVTCISGHTPIEEGAQSELVIYLIPWVELNPAREYRVFVKDRSITAISQQHLYSVYDMRHLGADAHIILDYFQSVIKERVMCASSYTIDIAVLDETNKPFFIELNPFGKEYSAGSSLFGWIEDYDILYGVAATSLGNATDDVETVYVRYTTRN